MLENLVERNPQLVRRKNVFPSAQVVAASQASTRGMPPALWKSNTLVMLSKGIGAFALSICLVNAFKDTSPFFLFSTSEYVQIFGRNCAPLIYNFQTPRIIPRPYFRNLSQ